MNQSKSSKAALRLMTWFVILTQVTTSAAFADINTFSKATLAPGVASSKNNPNIELRSEEAITEIACRFGDACLIGPRSIEAAVQALSNYPPYVKYVDHERKVTLNEGVINIPVKGDIKEVKVCLAGDAAALARLGGNYDETRRFAVRQVPALLDVACAGSESILGDKEALKTLSPRVATALGNIDAWSTAHRLGFRELPDQPKKVIDGIKSHVASRIKAGVKDVVVIGIGGQYMTNKTLQDSLTHPLYNYITKFRNGRPRIHMLGNIDPISLAAYLKENNLDPKTTDICLNSKSGDTVEPAVNGYFFLNWLYDHLGEEKALEHILVLTNDNDPVAGKLGKFFEGKPVARFPIPTADWDVGGRFSILAPTALISAAYAGIDIDKLLKGARDMKRSFARVDPENLNNASIANNRALLMALYVYYQATANDKDIFVISSFSEKLRSSTDFMKQLFGESLGKDGKGIFPCIATGNSSVNEFVASPQDKIFLFLNYGPERTDSPKLIDHPYVKINIPTLDEYTFGQLVYLCEEFTLWCGALFGIDPLIQPKVKLAKDITQGSLAKLAGHKTKTDTIELLGESDILRSGLIQGSDLDQAMRHIDDIGRAEVKTNGKDLSDMEPISSELKSRVKSNHRFVRNCAINVYRELIIVGDRVSLLRMRTIYQSAATAMHNISPSERGALPKVYFIDETKADTMAGLLPNIDLSKTGVLYVGTFHKDNIGKHPVKGRIMAYFEKYGKFKKGDEYVVLNPEPCDSAVEEEMGLYGLTDHEVLACAMFGLDLEDIYAYMEGYRRHPKEIAGKLAAYSYLLYNSGRGMTVNEVFTYSNQLGYFNSWVKSRYRSKFADLNRPHGPAFDAAIGSTDQHSILEPMLNWKNKIFTIFLKFNRFEPDFTVDTAEKPGRGLVPEYMLGHNMSELVDAMHYGVSKALTDAGRPNLTVNIPHLNPHYLGSLFGIFDSASTLEAGLLSMDITSPEPYMGEPLIGHGFTAEDLFTVEPTSWAVSEQFKRTVSELEGVIRNRSPSSLRDRLLTGLEEFKSGKAGRKMGIVKSRYEDAQHYYMGYGIKNGIGLGNEFMDTKDPLNAYAKEALLHELYQAVMSSGVAGEDIEGESTIHYTALRLQAMLFWDLNDVEQAAIQWMTPLELENHPKNLLKRAIIEWKSRHSPIPEEMWKDDWKKLLVELKDVLTHPERSYKKLADFLVVCNDASLAGIRHKYPVESRYPLLRAVTLLSDKERDLLVSILKANSKINKLAISDTILLMLGERGYDHWIEEQAPELAGRNIYQASSEIWYPGGGLGRVMQYHGEAEHTLLGPYREQLRQIEPGYHWRRNATGDQVPMDYRSRDVMANPIVTELEEVERFSITVGDRTTEAIVKRGKNDLGINVYLISDSGGFFTHSLYNYNDDGTNQQLPTWEQFTEFMCLASLELYRRQEEKELALKGDKWKPAIFHGNDAQFSLVWIYAMFATYSENGLTKRYADNPVIKATIKAFTTHTYFNREARSGKDGQNRLRTLHVPEQYWDEYFKSNRGSNWEEVYDLTSAGIRTADWIGAVARKHMNDVRIYDEWKGSLDLIAVTNGDSRARTSSVFRSILSDKSIFPNETVDLEHPTAAQILKAKYEAKRRVLLKPGQFHTSKPEADGSILNPDQDVIIYTGRLAPEKVGRRRAFCDENIEALVKDGKQVVLYANVQNYQESRDLANDITGFFDKKNDWHEGLIGKLKAKNHTGKLIFVPRFNLADQRALFAAANIGVVDSDPHTEAAGFSETDFASCGAIVVAPPWPDGEGILVAQGVRLNFDIEGEGNTIIPDVLVTEDDIRNGLVNNDTPLRAQIRTAYLAVMRRALDMPKAKFAKHMETSYRLSRVLEALPTGAEYLRQLGVATAKKESGHARQGNAVEGLKTVYRDFRYKAFTAKEFTAKRSPFSESTARRELLDLEALGLAMSDKEARPVAYQLAENIRNLSPPDVENIHSVQDLYRLTGASAKITSDMDKIHILNLRLRPPIEKGKFMYHVIPIEMIPEKIRPDFNKLVRQINANSREKIKIVARKDLLATVAKLAKVKGGRNIVDVAVPYRKDLRGLPKGVKALVFRGAVGGAHNVRQLEGIIAALRALQVKDTRALAGIYELMTGLSFTGRDEDILKYADDPIRLAAFIVFNLKPIRVEDYEALRSFNRSLIELIRSA